MRAVLIHMDSIYDFAYCFHLYTHNFERYLTTSEAALTYGGRYHLDNKQAALLV